MNNYPIGALNDSRAPYNEPLTKYADVQVSGIADINFNITLQVPFYIDENGEKQYDDIANIVQHIIKKRLNKDESLNNLEILDVYVH